MTRLSLAASRAAATVGDPRWALVRARDAGADGQFYYSVRTSGVYCRPSCKARPARPENVAFHATAEDAEAAGFRPCKRCKPTQTRLHISYVIGSSVLGKILLARTTKGVCALLLGDDADALKADLQQRFPAADLVADGRHSDDWLKTTVDYIADPAQPFPLPLDLHGTDFQRDVWQALQRVPAGRTASYADIAREIGKPAAVRAVAMACGANPVSVAVPCHRILRKDGALSGYRWGVARKAKLLAMEAHP